MSSDIAAAPAPPRSGALRYLLIGLAIGIPVFGGTFYLPQAIVVLIVGAAIVSSAEITSTVLPRRIVGLSDQLICAGFALILAIGMLVTTLGRPVVAVIWVFMGCISAASIPHRGSPFWRSRDVPISTYLRTGLLAGGYPAGWLCGGLALFMLPASLHIAQATVVLIVASDAGAWAIGRTLSGKLFKRAPFPDLSPRKTYEGLLGGFLAAVITGIAFSGYLPHHDLGWKLGLAIGLVAPLGDILASWLKRAAGVKDFSRLLGVHGGVMDRCDSASASFAVAYLIALLAGVL